ncbi:MAG: thioredoxin [Cardiobacteriaceae bacterium]|nr:thioredoxin [Cardiobacteriaceae bacterium]
MSKTLSVSQADFERVVLQAEQPVLVDFWAEWCGPCRMLAPTLDEVAQSLEGKALVVKINVDENGELASQFGIRSIPNLLLFKNGKVVDTTVGLQSKSALINFISAHL